MTVKTEESNICTQYELVGKFLMLFRFAMVTTQFILTLTLRAWLWEEPLEFH